eukprot:TRINITY_DN7319_c0_g1_i1.p1 TRINITY_DN7319_c0_g1~~TRINITY_DN7319_c0_g1_i1.p1  ORF type:complete len:233 (-),score=47.29 TRINITY_DN7319_c0_g1_i1:49-747(-)
MDHLLQHYEQDLADTLESIRQSIQAVSTTNDSEKKIEEVKKAEDNLGEAEQIIQQIEYSAISTNQIGKLRGRISEFEEQVKSLRKQLQSAEQNFQRNRLLGDAILNSNPLNEEVHQRVSDDTRRMERSSAVLRSTVSQAQDLTVQMEDTMVELDRQRHVMLLSSERLDTINDKLKTASGIISGMTRRVMTNKLIMGVIALVLAGSIALIIYLKFGPSNKEAPNEPPQTPEGG